jgi:hypothetical protein
MISTTAACLALSLSCWTTFLPIRDSSSRPVSPTPTNHPRAVANSFMQDLIANHIAEAAKKWDSSSFNSQDVETVEQQFIRPIFLSCGRPVDIREKRGSPAAGQHLMPNGVSRRTLTYLYSSKTTRDTHESKNRFTFSVGVEADANGRFFVSDFGCCCSKPPTRKRQPSKSI